MTIHATVRSRLAEAMRSGHGWRRTQTGPGYSIDTFTRDDDTIVVAYGSTNSELAACQIYGEQVPLTSPVEQVTRQIERILREDRHVRRFHKVVAASTSCDVIPHEVLDIESHGTWLRVGEFDGGYTMWWSDGVANDWTEWHPTLPVVLARVAVLFQCIDGDCAKSFARYDFEFQRETTAWLNGQLV